MILDEFVEVTANGANINHYKNLGYTIPMKSNGKCDLGKTFLVKVSDLSKGSHTKIKIACDSCGSIIYPAYKDYLRYTKTNNGLYYCVNCNRNLASKRWADMTEEEKRAIFEKQEKTMIERYGVKSPLQYSEFLEKAHQSIKDRFGVDHAAQSPEIIEKMRNTTFHKYGVYNYTQTNEYKNIMKEYFQTDRTMQYKHAKETVDRKIQENPLYYYDRNAKSAQTYYANSSTKTSKQQKAIYDVYKKINNCELNYPVTSFPCDIVFLDDKIDFEVDYGGHWLRVILGQTTQKEFEQKELVRDKMIKSQGYKVVRLITHKIPNIPTESKLLEILSLTRKYFEQYPNHTWINWDMDNSIRRDAEHMDGIPFDFGELIKPDVSQFGDEK